jgi:ADP-L-glycero-D-manno-heptose 6-epimerase
VTAVVHLGACADTMEMDEAVHERLNLAYSRRVWEACTRHAIPLVYASSAATYGAGDNGWSDDERLLPRLAPLNPYAWSKHRFDLWALEQERRGAAPPRWAGFKLFNVYGFGERHKAQMASMVLHAYDQIARTRRVRLFKSHRAGVADGDQRRDFVCVEDVVQVLLHAARGTVPRGIYNVGTGRARSFLDLATATFRALRREPRVEFVEMPAALRGRYQSFTQAPIGALRASGYTSPFTSLDEGIAGYVERLQRGRAVP